MFDLVVAAEDDRVDAVVAELTVGGVAAHGVQADLATREGCETLASAVGALGRPVDALARNAGVGVSGPFLTSGTLEDQLNVIDLDARHVVHLAHRLVPAMVARGEGRVLITSSIVATVAAPFQATYSGSKAFLQSFSGALREGIKDRGVTVTALQPGGTDTEFWERSGAEDQDTKVTDTTFEDPATVARDGFDGLMRGDDHVAPAREPVGSASATTPAPTPTAPPSRSGPRGGSPPGYRRRMPRTIAGRAPTPPKPGPVLRATAALFGALATARHDRSMHGPGVAFRCRLAMTPTPAVGGGAPFFARAATYDATIRFSRGIGLPQPAADLLGIAIRAHDAQPGGGPQDLLVTSSGGRRGTRRLLLPARDGFFGQWFSSVLPYRIGDDTTVLGVRATTAPAGEGTDFERLQATHARGELTFALALATRTGWVHAGTIHVGARLSDAESTALSFDPWTTGPGVRPAGVLNRLRSAAYPASRRARRAFQLA